MSLINELENGITKKKKEKKERKEAAAVPLLPVAAPVTTVQKQEDKIQKTLKSMSVKNVIRHLPDQAILRLIEVSINEMVVNDVNTYLKGMQH